MNNHSTENCRKPLKSSKRPHNTGNANIACYHCAETGHLKKDCPVWKRVQETFNHRNSERALLANDDSQALVVANRAPGYTANLD
jgi:hypothetical protein